MSEAALLRPTGGIAAATCPTARRPSICNPSACCTNTSCRSNNRAGSAALRTHSFAALRSYRAKFSLAAAAAAAAVPPAPASPAYVRLPACSGPGQAARRRSATAAALGDVATASKVARDSLAAALTTSNLPRWLLVVRCVGSITIAITAASFVSRHLSDTADKQDEGDVRTAMPPTPPNSVSSSKKLQGCTISSHRFADKGRAPCQL